MLNPNKINTNTFIKRLFEEQYGNSPALFAKYQQLDKREKILFVDGIDNIKTDTQETKKKVLGGYIREPFEFSFSWAERTGAEATKRIAPAPTVVKIVVRPLFERLSGGALSVEFSVKVRSVVNRASLYMPPACFNPVCDTNCGQNHSPKNQLLRRSRQRKEIRKFRVSAGFYFNL